MPWFENDFVAFFLELKANNNKEWFHENKKRYEKMVKEPFHDFVAEMIGRIQKDDPSVAIQPKEAIFRINRDIRFAKDKTPYKTNVSAVISPGGRKDFSTPGIYFEFSPNGVQVYGGAHHVEKDQLLKVRTAIMKDPAEFNKVVKAISFITNFGELLGQKNKRLPKEFMDAAEKLPILFNKTFYYGATLDLDVLLSENLADQIYELYLAGKPFNSYFKKVTQ
ncbi:MAG: DUF2461 domain-containing protein [Calditrichaeota bacterium]|nr:DUF2461 domain-containing protein [Calditrichota bacterium]